MSDRGRDLVLAPNEFAFISDETKGNINVYVGPHKTSLANTDQPVVFSAESKRFDRCSLEEATQTQSIAPEGWYLVLKNPARDSSHPRTGALNNLPELNVGRKVNIPGPVSFALWPGQMVKVIKGHHLRSNQYLLVRVYDEEAAKANWKNSVIKPQSAAGEGAGAASGPGAAGAPDESLEAASLLRAEQLAVELTMGKLLIIRGTDVSFFIPPTGVEVVPDDAGNHVREAVTLERLEYCILLDESGNKRYIQGPDVVFPRPTETFVLKNGSRKFRAIELSETSGIYLKVIAPYQEDGQSYKVGDELFLTGKDQMIYFPRPEHAIIKYGEREIHHAVAIPAGEGRYVLDRQSGAVSLRRGPMIFLPDPRKEVIVRRVLDLKHVALWFPGNTEALEYNRRLAAIKTQQGEQGDYVQDRAAVRARPAAAAAAPAPSEPAAPPAGFAGDELTRSQNFARPRTIVLDTRYDGAVSIDTWTGYAVLVVSKTGDRRVVVGPATHMLEYDQTLQPMELSTGTPKTDENPLRTVYLRVLNNKVSDRVEAETHDLCTVHLHLSYRLNFEGDPARWFNVENYVKFLCEHLRSLIRHVVKQHGIEDFYANAASVLRDAILGVPGEDSKRPGRRFEENGMRVYDVEILDVRIGDEAIEKMLVSAQHAAVQQALALAGERRKLEFARQSETISQQIADVQSSTRQQALQLKTREVTHALEAQLAEIHAEAQSRKQRQALALAEQEALGAIQQAELARKRAGNEVELELSARQLEQRLREVDAQVRAVAEKARAVSPDLIAAMQAFGDRALAEKMAESMAPLAILGGESVADVLARLLSGTPLAAVLKRAEGNGGAQPPQLPPRGGKGA